jgi:uncharacterized membrane protein YccC
VALLKRNWLFLNHIDTLAAVERLVGRLTSTTSQAMVPLPARSRLSLTSQRGWLRQMVDAKTTRAWSATWRAALFQGATAAVVAVFCYSTVRLVPSLLEPYWAPIAAVVVLYPNRQATKKAAVERFFGTIIGSLVGWGGASWWHQNVAAYGLAVLVAVGICYLLHLENASRLCAVAVTVITIISRAEPARWVAFHRFVEVSYGVICALLFTILADFLRRRWRWS